MWQLKAVAISLLLTATVAADEPKIRKPIILAPAYTIPATGTYGKNAESTPPETTKRLVVQPKAYRLYRPFRLRRSW